MTRGYVSSFDARRGTGFVRPVSGGNRIPFSTRGTKDLSFHEGDSVEYRVTGGKAGVMAHQVRPAC